MKNLARWGSSCFLLASLLLASPVSFAQKRYDPGANDSEIRIGQTMPYSGPVSMLGTVGKAASAYFEKLNTEGGINGRKVKLLSMDDGYNPVKTVEMTRKLVEQDEVLLMFNSVGTATNLAVHRYLNGRKVPQLLILSGANRWNDPKNFPWTMSGMFSYEAEARVYTRHALANVRNPRIAILSQNDDFGRDFLKGVMSVLGDKAKSLIVAQATYEVTDPTVNSQMVALKESGANIFLNFSNGKFTSQAIRRANELGWAPQMYLPIGSSSIASILQPAGPDKSIGAITIGNQKNPLDPQWKDDPAMKEYYAFMQQWAPSLDSKDSLNVSGVTLARVIAEVLRRCGDTLTHDNVIKQMQSLRDYSTPLMLPGVSITTAADDYELYSAVRLQKFDGKSWVPFGDAAAAR